MTKIEVDKYVQDNKINDIISKVNNIFSAKVVSVKPLIIDVNSSNVNKVIDVLERANVKYKRK